jgi:hypothetical protein
MLALHRFFAVLIMFGAIFESCGMIFHFLIIVKEQQAGGI